MTDRADDSGRFGHPPVYPPAPDRNPWDEQTQPMGPYGTLRQRVSEHSKFVNHARGAIWAIGLVGGIIIGALSLLILRWEETRDTARSNAARIETHAASPGHEPNRKELSEVKGELIKVKVQLGAATKAMGELVEEVKEERAEHNRLRRRRR